VVSARTVFAGAGRLSGLAWSPDGRWLLAAWTSADQWLFLRASGPGIRAVSGIARQFDPRARRARGAPRVGGWTR
jgi:hypothetical protein